jgi:DNA replication protein DnaC
LAAVLAEEVGSREAHGGEHRVRAARFPQLKTLDDFDVASQRSADRQMITYLHQLDFVTERKNVIFLGSPGPGKTHPSIALGIRAARRGFWVAFASGQDWVGRLAAKRLARLEQELERLRHVIFDEVGYIPFDPVAANLFVVLVSSRYERSSLIVSSNKTFSSWGEIFWDAVAVAAVVDRLVHHAEVVVLEGESYRLKDRAKEESGARKRR